MRSIILALGLATTLPLPATELTSLPEKVVYFGAGTVMGTLSVVAQAGWGISLLLPWSTTFGNECLLLSQICDIAARSAFAQMLNTHPSTSSLQSWNLHRQLLSQIPAATHEDKQLLQFLQKRWLSKSTGMYPGVVNWISPCFGLNVQIHPESTNSYARDPSNKFSDTYLNVVQAWKQVLHCDFPLILTRPADIKDYLPPCVSAEGEKAMNRLAVAMQVSDTPVLLDCTDVDWKKMQPVFERACEENRWDKERIFAIQRLKREELGGICMLPLVSTVDLEKQHQFLLEWISKFGLSANRIELDRCSLTSKLLIQPGHSIEPYSKKAFLADLKTFEQNCVFTEQHHTLMLNGMLRAIKTLLLDEKHPHSQTETALAQLCFSKIKEEFSLIGKEGVEAHFHDFVSHIEQIHSYLCELLEIMSPYSEQDFPHLYADLLTSTPSQLKSLASYANHCSGMASLGGIFKAVETASGKKPCVLYGENTYFENIYAAQKITRSTPISEATDKDWEEADLILGQFNPALRRIDFEISEYHVEPIAAFTRKALSARNGKPLTLAIDCTLDFIDSPRVGSVLAEFQEAIEQGALNVICYRSGVKYDLFGMDNYCGAPFYMIHNQAPHWAAYNSLITHPALKTDRLSLNWFCLAFKSTAPQLELYRKQIFDNTRAFLDKVPTRLINSKETRYRIVPIDRDADPAFVDIKIFGPLHEIKGQILVSGLLTLKSMEAGHPIFYRPSLGFYYPNFSLMFSEKCTTIRLTLGLDPSQVDLLADCFAMIDTLNGSPWQVLRDKIFSSRESVHHRTSKEPLPQL